MAQPTGTATFGRRVEDLENLAIGSGFSTGGSGSPIICLNNRPAAAASPLALYSVLAWRGDARKLAVLELWSTVIGSATGLTQMLYPQAGMISGDISVQDSVLASAPLISIFFEANGSTWLEHGDLPLLIIPVGYRAQVWPRNPIGSASFVEAMSVTFVWGKYARRPRARARKLVTIGPA